MKLTWHTFAGGTSAAEGKNSYQAITGGLNGREMYLIDPISWPNGRHRIYQLQYFGPGGYRTLGNGSRVPSLKKEAQAHFNAQGSATNPRRAIMAAHARGVRNPRDTSTRTEVRSPTRTSTSTKAYTAGNVTVTGGAGAGSTTVNLKKNPRNGVRIALQAQLAGTLWATIQTYPNTAAGKEAAISAAKITHKKIPAQAMRVIRVKRAA